MKLLLISNSTNAGEEYLDHPKEEIRNFLGEKTVKALFIPYAAVTFPFSDYEKKVQNRFREVGHDIESIHNYPDPVKAVEKAEAIVVGGGNTWQLLRMINDYGLIEPVRKKVLDGTRYIGWSAGANMACPTIMTTNDMPIMDPGSFNAFNFIPFQINPHYLDANPDGHAGETRQQRIEEFLVVNPGMYVAGLREGTMFLLENKKLCLIGPRKMRLFRKGDEPAEFSDKDDLSFLLDMK
ncbi:MAG: dipeptidase PepE [Bacteroidota bacterium]|nr:dipeptidase PepE [Bacteroidota bacterium]